MAIDVIASSSKIGFDGIGLKMSHLILGFVHNSCHKFNVYLVSKTCLLISLKYFFKVFYIVTCSEMTNY